MATLPKSLQNISLFLQRLPGIGEKTANRLAFYLLRVPDSEIEGFAQSLLTLKRSTHKCSVCCNLTEGADICLICADDRRSKDVVTVVESVFDILAFEVGGIYSGTYHVLHGKIDPLNRVTPDDLTIARLLERITTSPPNELILATNPDMEGEATAMYIDQKVREIQDGAGSTITVTRLGYGMPLGASVEYADYGTLKKALEGRRKV